MATPAGFEPATCRLEGGCSIQLSYGAELPCRETEQGREGQCVHCPRRVDLKLSEYENTFGTIAFGSSTR